MALKGDDRILVEDPGKGKTTKGIHSWTDVIDLVMHVFWGHEPSQQVVDEFKQLQKVMLDNIKSTTMLGTDRRLRVLLVQVVEDSERSVTNFEDNHRGLRQNSAGDVFEFALFHHDGSNDHWRNRSWYNESFLVKKMKATKEIRGCKPVFWREITPDVASKYDYIWLMDEDVRLDWFSWELYRTVLVKLDYPLVSQPAITAGFPTAVKSRIGFLTFPGLNPTSRTFAVAETVMRTEVQSPVISTKLWPAMVQRINHNDLGTDWFIDSFWDIIAFASKRLCGKTSPLKINAAPVAHMSYHNLHLCGNSCTGHGRDNLNCRKVTADEDALALSVLRDVCGSTDGMNKTLAERWPIFSQESRTKWDPNCYMEESVIEARKITTHWNEAVKISTASLVRGLTGSDKGAPSEDDVEDDSDVDLDEMVREASYPTVL